MHYLHISVFGTLSLEYCHKSGQEVCVIYCHLSKLSVGQTPRLCSLPSKSFSNNINVPFTGDGNLVKESGEPFNGMPEKF